MNPMMSDKKKIAAVIVGGGEPREKEVGDVEQDSSIGQRSAAEELLSAIAAKDAAGVVSALKSFVQMCMAEEESYEEPKSSENPFEE